MNTDPQHLADELAIRALVERYGDAVMRFDGETWADCWAEDASWTLPGGPTVTGRANILGAWQQAMAGFEFVGFFGNFGPIHIDGDKASATLYQQETLIGKDGSKRRVIGRYDDEHVRDGDRWRFSSRNYQILHMEEF